MNDFGLYVIITAPDHSIETIAETCVKQNVKMLQIREKDAEDREILAMSKKILSITKGSETKFIMNDRVDLALAAGADGVHLGQGDIPLESVRAHFPQSGKLITGVSTHSIEQAKEALATKPDYIGFGPVYPTFAKKKPDPAVGTELLQEVLAFANVPVVAIGGINRDNVDAVLKAGAKNICMIKALMKAKNLTDEIRYFSEILR